MLELSESKEETQQILDNLYLEATKQTPETVGEFIKKLVTEYSHDYGTICHVAGIAASAGAWAIQNGPQGSLSGAQAGFVFWQFRRGWSNHGKKDNTPMRLVDYSNMLYPQYENSFRTITKDTWEWLQDKVRADGPHGVGAVKEHQQSILDGIVPFGYGIE